MHTMCYRLMFITCLLALGCGSADQQKPVYKTTGTVLYNGQPLEGARVLFYPIDRVMLPKETPSGSTDADGSFSISTYGTDDGAPTGYYRVAIVPPGLKLDGPFPLTYVDPMRSGLQAQVNSAVTLVPVFELKGPPLK